MKLTRPLLGAFLALGIVACAGNSRPAYEVPISVDDLTTTHVHNLNTFPLTIYLTQAGMRHRLGVVESMSTAMFMVPPRLLNGRLEFRLLGSPLGPHPTFVSETFQLQPGQSAGWRIQDANPATALSLVSVQ